MQSIKTIYESDFTAIHLQGKSKQARGQYRWTLKNFQLFLGREPRLTDLTDRTIADWLAWLSHQPWKGRVRAVATVNGRRDYMLAFCGWLHRRGYLRVMPEVPPLPEPEKIPRAWTMEELKRLYDAACGLKGRCKGIPAGHLWGGWISLSWDSAERTGAMLRLRSEWIVDHMLIVPGAVRKNGKKAVYQLKDATLNHLRMSGYESRELIFPISTPTYTKWYRRILKIAGLPDDSQCLNHKIRRSFASHLERAGGDATKALQHTSRKVTEMSYLDPSIITIDNPNRLLSDIG